jgi:hypothetical protein
LEGRSRGSRKGDGGFGGEIQRIEEGGPGGFGGEIQRIVKVDRGGISDG